jgi:hypothetical protein
MEALLFEVSRWLLVWGVPVVLALIGLGVLVRLGAAMTRRRNGHYGQDIHAALRSLGEGVLYAALPLSFIFNVIFGLPAGGPLWVIMAMVVVVFAIAVAYLVWAMIKDVVDISFEPEASPVPAVRLPEFAPSPVIVEREYAPAGENYRTEA